MSIVKVFNKKVGVTYVYESESYWDKEKQQPRNRRKLIGKIDPATGEIVPTGRPGRRPKASEGKASAEGSATPEGSDYAALVSLLDDRNRENAALKDRIRDLESQCRRKDDMMDRIRSIVEERPVR